jgi:hypothetical protein
VTLANKDKLPEKWHLLGAVHDLDARGYGSKADFQQLRGQTPQVQSFSL